MIWRAYLYGVLAYWLTCFGLAFWRGGFSFIFQLDWGSFKFLLIFSLLAAAVGLFIGVFLSAVYQRPAREKWFYFIGQLLPFGFVVYGIISMNATEKKEQPKTNSEANAQYIEGFSRDCPVLSIAFDSLEKQFKDPSDFKIETSFSVAKNLVNHSPKDSIWIIVIAYSLPHDKVPERYANFFVLDGVARMTRFNHSQGEEEYLRLAGKMQEMKALADSINKAIDSK